MPRVSGRGWAEQTERAAVHLTPAPRIWVHVAVFSGARRLSRLDKGQEIGTTWSSSPWMMRVGTSTRLRSSVWPVSENALMQKKAAGKAASMPRSQKDSRTPSETLDPSRL